jgi:hypothetical protein
MTRHLSRCRGLGAGAALSGSASESEDASGSSDLEGEEPLAIGGDDDVELDASEWGVGAAAGRPDADATLRAVPEATARLAAVDLDWTRIRAVDIYAVLRSFVGARGALRRVVVYVSDYGKEQMAREKEHGPQGLADDKVLLQAPPPPLPASRLSHVAHACAHALVASQRLDRLGLRVRRRTMTSSAAARAARAQRRRHGSGCGCTSAAACAGTTPSRRSTPQPQQGASTRSATGTSLKRAR